MGYEDKMGILKWLQVKENCSTDLCRKITTYQPGFQGHWISINNVSDTSENTMYHISHTED